MNLQPRLVIIGALAFAVACGSASRPAPAPAPAFARAQREVAPAAPPATTLPIASNQPTPQVVSPTTPAAAPERAVDDRDPHSLPEAVKKELKHMQEHYAELPKLRILPDFLSVKAVLALFPEPAEKDYLLTEIHTQLEGGEASPLLGTYLDEEQRLFVLWVAGNLSQLLAVFNGERLAGRAAISRGKPLLGDVLAEGDGFRQEILVETITTMSVCCLPSSLEVFRVGKQGALTKVLSFPKSYVQVGPGVRWGFLRHFEFTDNRVLVSRVHPEGGDSYELVFDKRVGRYQPTPATRKLLAQERKQRTEASSPAKSAVAPPSLAY